MSDDQLREYAECILNCVTKSETCFGACYDRDVKKPDFGLMEPYELAAAWIADHPQPAPAEREVSK